MNLKRLLGADNGWGGAAGTLLLLVAGLGLLLFSVAGLSEASRLKPVERGCSEWLKDPSGPKWVTLVGCQLDADGGVAIGAQGALVTGYVEDGLLNPGAQPQRKNVLIGLLVGLVAVALAVRSMFMRYLVERDSTH